MTEAQALQALESFKAEADKATGRVSGRARFYGFLLVDGLKELYGKALEHFKAAEFNHVEGVVRQASTWLDKSQRKFCANSVDKFFMPMILDMPHLDEDLQSNVLKKKDEFAVIAAQVGRGEGDLDQASELSWRLRDAILRAPVEQEARVENRMKQQLIGKKKLKDQKVLADAERSRAAQRQQEAEQAQRRQQVAQELAL